MKLSFSTNGWQELSWSEFVSTANELGFSGIEIHNITDERFTGSDAPFNKQYYIEGRPETECAYMGCRTRVIGNVHDPERQVVGGRGNLSFGIKTILRGGYKHTATVVSALHCGSDPYFFVFLGNAVYGYRLHSLEKTYTVIGVNHVIANG